MRIIIFVCLAVCVALALGARPDVAPVVVCPGELNGGGCGDETSWAWGDCGSTCFIDLPEAEIPSTRWGFTNSLGCTSDADCAGKTTTLTLRAGCGRCELTNCARQSGTVTVTFLSDGKSADVCVSYGTRVTGKDLHVWIGLTPLPLASPTSYVIAPGLIGEVGNMTSGAPLANPTCLNVKVVTDGVPAANLFTINGTRYAVVHSADTGSGSGCGAPTATTAATTTAATTTAATTTAATTTAATTTAATTTDTTTTAATTTTEGDGGGGGGGGGGSDTDDCECNGVTCTLLDNGGLYRLANHPRAEYVNSNFGYGLRVDGMAPANGIFVFDFEHSSSSMFLRYDKAGGYVTIFGVSIGGALNGDAVKCNGEPCIIADPKLYDINYRYTVVQEENQVVAFFSESDGGTIGLVNQPASYALKGTNMEGAVFLLNVGEYRGWTGVAWGGKVINSVTGYGWLALAPISDLSTRIEVHVPYYQDWSFIVSDCVDVNNDPCAAGSRCLTPEGICVVKSTCDATCPSVWGDLLRVGQCDALSAPDSSSTSFIIQEGDLSAKSVKGLKAQDALLQAMAAALAVPRWRLSVTSVTPLSNGQAKVDVSVLDGPVIPAGAGASSLGVTASAVVVSLNNQLSDPSSPLRSNQITGSARPNSDNNGSSRSGPSLELVGFAVAGALLVIVSVVAIVLYKRQRARSALMEVASAASTSLNMEKRHSDDNPPNLS